ncbi:MAG: STY4526/YPO1902 family pathogenicity island replication protein [Pseudomonadota bacterium]
MENNHNNALNTFIIQHIYRLYKRRDFEGLNDIGLSKETAKRVASLSLEDVARLESFRAKIAELRVTESHLEMMIAHVQHEGAKEELVDQLIQLGASQVMLWELSGIDHAEYRERRKTLGLPKASAGRPSALTEEESTALHIAWQRYADEEDILLRYYYVGLCTEISLSRVWNYLQTPN